MALYTRLLILLAFFAITPMQAQDKTTPRDTVKEKQDQMYKELEDYSKRRKFTKFIHKLVFRAVKEKAPSKKRKEIKKAAPEMQIDYTRVQGKIVRKIIIEIDVFRQHLM